MGKYLIIALLVALFCYSNQKTVIIVGAGVSGIAAATTLKDNTKHTIEILESNTKYGGRVRTDTSLGFPVDLGASWIHGSTNNPVSDLAKEGNVLVYPFDYENASVFSNNLSVNTFIKDRETLTNKFYPYLISKAQKLEAGNDLDVRSVADSFVVDSKLTTKEKTILNSIIFSEFESEFAAKAEELSIRAAIEGKSGQGEDVLFPGGYIDVFKPTADKLTIKYSTRVTEIDTSAQVVIKTEGGQTFSADAVIVTVPLGVLKKGSIKFVPELNAARKEAISKLGFGTLEKIVVEFTEKFWDDKNILTFVNEPTSHLGFSVNLHKVAGKNALMFIYGGSRKYYDVYSKSNEQVSSDIVSFLKTYFPSKNIVVKKIIISKWEENPNAYGSYSFIAEGSSSSMRASFTEYGNNEKLFFGGEHTDKSNPATVHGAWNSGILAANDFILFNGSIANSVSAIILVLISLVFLN